VVVNAKPLLPIRYVLHAGKHMTAIESGINICTCPHLERIAVSWYPKEMRNYPIKGVMLYSYNVKTGEQEYP
jgi:hypothetical protein